MGIKTQRDYDAIAPITLTGDGTTNGRIELADTSMFKVGQKIILKATGLSKSFQIKKIPSNTEILLGELGKSICNRSDVSAFTVALGATIQMNAQCRPNIPLNEISRAVYEEEPAMAIRAFLVDENGNPAQINLGDATIDNLNVDMDIECAKTFNVLNVDITTSNQIVAVTLPTGLKKLTMRHRDRGNLEFAFENTLTNFFTVRKGNTFNEQDLCLDSATLYFRSDKIGTLEIITWV